MNLLDIRSLLLIITLVLTTRAIVFAFVWTVARRYPPLGHWALGSILIAVGALLTGLRDIAPPEISILLAQAILIPGWMLIDAGIVTAAGRRVPWRAGLAVYGVTLLALIWYTEFDASYPIRTAAVTLPVILYDLYALTACLQLKNGPRVATLRVLAAALAVMVLSNLWKVGGTLAMQNTTLFEPNVALVQFLIFSIVSCVVSTALFVLLAAQKLQEELDQELKLRKQTEDELKRHKEQLESLVRERTSELEKRNAQLDQTQFAMDRVGIGVAWNELETGRFIYVNNEACRQLGYSRDELLALGAGDINPGITASVLGQITASLRAGDGRLRRETVHHRKDGSSYPVEITTYLHHAEGREWFISFYNDISARKSAEADLITAKEAAESASRAKNAFLANMSHELRTPMNAIMGMSYLARHRIDDPQLHHYLDEVDTASNRLLRIINNVLDIAQIESNRLELVPVEFSVPEVLEKAERLVAAEIAEKGLAFSVDISRELAVTALRGDAIRLGQILNSLVGNAVKFTARGTVALKATAHDVDEDGLLLRVDVIDSGIGIDARDQQRLFIAFEQADTSSTRKYGGTGLGLAISKRLAQMMGGEMGVSSQPGAGSHFWFTVRLERAIP